MTVLKTANIMPDGGRDFILTTPFVESSLSLIRRTVALADLRFSKLSTGLRGRKRNGRQRQTGLPAIAFVRFGKQSFFVF